MVQKKLNLFQKLLGKLGKHYYWSKSRKMNLWMLSSMAYGVTKKYEEIYEGDTGLAVDTFTNHFVNGARAIMFEMQDRIRLLYSKSLKDLEFLAKTALFVILGPDWNKFLSEPTFIPAEKTPEGIPQFRITIPVCALCTGLRPGIDLAITKLRKHTYGELLAAALASLLQAVQDYVGNEYNLEIKETKCILLGDPQGEAIVYFYPKDKNKPK